MPIWLSTQEEVMNYPQQGSAKLTYQVNLQVNIP